MGVWKERFEELAEAPEAQRPELRRRMARVSEGLCPEPGCSLALREAIVDETGPESGSVVDRWLDFGCPDHGTIYRRRA